MEDQVISRVNYYPRQFLRLPDFADEQAYHLLKERLHQLAHHRPWGIIRGLELTLDPDCNPVLQPGVAIDGYGRDLVWANPEPLPLGDFKTKGSDVLNVWLAYNLVTSDPAGEGYAGCGSSTSDDAFNRVEEQPSLHLEPPDPAFPDPRFPAEVPDEDLDFSPTRMPPDSPTAFWPVFLGQVIRKRPKPDKPYQYSLNLAGRPYAGLVGESIHHPTNRGRVEVGVRQGGNPDTKEARFAVFLEAPNQKDCAPPVETEAEPRLEVSAAGEMTVRGDSIFEGNVTVAGAMIFEETKNLAKPDSAKPWQFYRAKDPNGKNELRLDLAKSTDVNQFVIGSWRKGADGKESFQPCLTVDDDCNVTIAGNLIVKNYIKKGPFDSSTPVTTEVKGLMAAAAASASTDIQRRVQDLDARRSELIDQLRDNPKELARLISELKPDALNDFAKELLAALEAEQKIDAFKRVICHS